MSQQPIGVFFSYSHKDEHLMIELVKQLSILRRHGVIREWHDRQITAGSEWEGQIDKHLNTAKIILLLISSDFLDSDYCYDIELKRAMQRHYAGEAYVIPVILRPVDWHRAPFSRLQVLPRNAMPVTKWSNQDDAFQSIAQEIERVAGQIRRPPQKRYPAPTEIFIPDDISINYDLSRKAQQQKVLLSICTVWFSGLLLGNILLKILGATSDAFTRTVGLALIGAATGTLYGYIVGQGLPMEGTALRHSSTVVMCVGCSVGFLSWAIAGYYWYESDPWLSNSWMLIGAGLCWAAIRLTQQKILRH